MDSAASPSDIKPPRYAGFWVRLGAMLIDGIVLAPSIAITLYAATHSLSIYQALLLPIALLGILYQVIMIERYGATLGKMAVHIKVVRLSGEGVSYNRSALRYSIWTFFQLKSVLLTCIAINRISPDLYYTLNLHDKVRYLDDYKPHIYYFLEIVEALWLWSAIVALLANEKNRTIHDFIAGTVVIHTRAATSLPEVDLAASFDARMQQHLAWLASNGASGARGDFAFMNLRGRDLQGANFTRANLRSANLGGTDLRGANLENAVLNDTMLVGVTMNEETRLTGANLIDAFVDAKDFLNARVNLRGFARVDLPAKLRPLWDEQQKPAAPTVP